MVINKSLDESKIIAALLHDVHTSHGVVFNSRSRRLTLNKVMLRVRKEGIGFLTKTMPRLAKAFDKALAGDTKLNSVDCGFESQPNSKLPRFLGEFFNRVLSEDGALLPLPCADSVIVIRQVLYLFYKYKLPYTDEQEQTIISRFKQTEDDLCSRSQDFKNLATLLEQAKGTRRHSINADDRRVPVAREARILLSRIFSFFDPRNIAPRHGPGVVATKQRLWSKYEWTNVSKRITDQYPLDEYFFVSLGHVCDRLDTFKRITENESHAKVILVPKDSRGPRLISCEPVDFQWVQQGLSRAMVQLVENHELTKFNVFFTDQGPNGRGALLGSGTGRYATLDLNEASDRVSLDLVRLLFPPHVFTCMEACRSLSTELPSGEIIELQKFAPMGSALCFPTMALIIWSLLTAAAPDADTRESILVYGDDVIVPTAYAVNAMELLESFGLKINRDKSCISGLFRESCGVDAFKGVNVTPVRLRTVWSSSPCASVYSSWISYANSFYDKQYYNVYELIVESLVSIYGPIPGDDMSLTCPSLRVTPEFQQRLKSRTNKRLQKREFRVWDIKSPSISKEIDGWSMLLRYFAEVGNSSNSFNSNDGSGTDSLDDLYHPRVFSASSYTSRRTSMLVRRWR